MSLPIYLPCDAACPQALNPEASACEGQAPRQGLRRRWRMACGVCLATSAVGLVLSTQASVLRDAVGHMRHAALGSVVGEMSIGSTFTLNFPISFEGPYVGRCPSGWICKGDAKVCRHPPLSPKCNHPGLSGVDGRQYLSLGNDLEKGSALSTAFFLPKEIDRIEFKRSGGANGGSGFYLYLLRDDKVICQSEDEINTNVFLTDSCMALAAYAGEAVYIRLKDNASTSWGKVLIDDIRLKDKFGKDIHQAVGIPSPLAM
eukprot:CAMPEP_0197894458 /NCGR_PEP_ID=MMETSP1439-20131203/35612_1 /TAXON_ID=66791 /ORGANISM="Gonyaulax spinifera, Strain CCMP409" /LENGTH=258 /DNA_ID=CAMNT_0043514815 /DNA_START=95 /DNA_END=871 /DNA_ORIENTATION=+